LGLGLKGLAFKTAAAPIAKAAVATTHLAFATGATGTVVGGVLTGIVLSTATAAGIGAWIHKAVSDGFMSDTAGRNYAKQIENEPLHKQVKIFGEMQSTWTGGVEHVPNNNGVHA